MGKGETLLDTALNLNAMKPEVIVLRHSSSRAAHLISQHVSASVVHAGDGMHEHAAPALLDSENSRPQKGYNARHAVLVVGDIAHSSVARSNIHALKE